MRQNCYKKVNINTHMQTSHSPNQLIKLDTLPRPHNIKPDLEDPPEEIRNIPEYGHAWSIISSFWLSCACPLVTIVHCLYWCLCGCSSRDDVRRVCKCYRGSILVMDVFWRRFCVSMIWGKVIYLFWVGQWWDEWGGEVSL